MLLLKKNLVLLKTINWLELKIIFFPGTPNVGSLGIMLRRGGRARREKRKGEKFLTFFSYVASLPLGMRLR